MTAPSPPDPPRLRFEIGGIFAAVAIALRRGAPIASIIDLGCADGLFALNARRMAPLAGAAILNIDAQAVYEPSLRRIQRAHGGHYRICAVCDRSGTTDLTTAAHPYWSSVLPPSDDYWRLIEGTARETVPVAARTLDEIVAETGLPPPHLLKLDIQGAERVALAAAPRTLAATNLVLVETFVHEFPDIHRLLVDSGFDLFDLTALQRGSDHGLSWFYPVYASRRLNLVAPRPIWLREATDQVLAVQAERRTAQLRELDELLAPYETP
jgi:FkbM family methyltransferase